LRGIPKGVRYDVLMMFRPSRAVLCLALAALALPASFGKKPDRKNATAVILDHNSYICNNCFFGTSDYYYCFDAGDKILIGYQKIPSMSWKEHNTNLLTRVRKNYAPWAPEGDRINLTYDDKMIYVNRGDGKETKLIQNYQTDIFLHSSVCRGAVHKTE
jgi:hypothetical protein